MMPDTQDPQAVPQSEPKMLTQKRLDEIIAERLREQKAQSDRELENLRSEAQQRIAALTGQETSTTDFLRQQVADKEAKQSRLSQLEEMYFGPSPEAGRRSNELAK